MTRCPAVVVKIDAVLDGELHELQHPFSMMLDGVAIVADLFRHPEVKAEASPQPLHARRDAVAVEEALESAVKPIRDGVDVVIEARPAVSGDSGQPGGDGDDVA